MGALEVVLLIVEILLFLVLLIVFLGGYVTYRMAFYNNPKKNKVDPYRHIKDNDEPRNLFSNSLVDRILSIPYEDVYITSYDGLKLRGRLYLVDEKTPFAIQFHGYRPPA